jgi:membrane protease YdiL (CAAX protease family)
MGRAWGCLDFFPDKLAIIFLFGLIAGWYYYRERNLAPLMVTHALPDLWSVGLVILGLI